MKNELSPGTDAVVNGERTRKAARRYYDSLPVICVVVMALALLVRLPLVSRLGHGFDLEEYRLWTAAIQRYGLPEVFDRTNTDYVGYNYLLWAIGKAYNDDAGAVTLRNKTLRFWLKLPGLIGDLASTLLVVAIAYDLTIRRPLRRSEGRSAQPARIGLRVPLVNDGVPRIPPPLAAGLWWGINPALVYMSAYWGQNDSLVTAFALGAFWAALRRRVILAAIVLILGATLKPQPLILAPVIAWIIAARGGWSGLARATAAGVVALVAGHLYFIVTGHLDDVLRIYHEAAVTPQRLTYSAYNLWWPLAHSTNPSASDIAFAAGSIAVRWGTVASALVVGVVAVAAAGLRRDHSDAGALVAAGYLIFGFFMVGAGVHERYALPALAFLVLAMIFRPVWTVPVLVLTCTLTADALLTLPFDRHYPQGRPVWLTLVTAGVNICLLVYATRLMIRGNRPAQGDWAWPAAPVSESGRNSDGPA